MYEEKRKVDSEVPTLVTVMNRAFDYRMRDIYTSLPGYIVKFNPETQRASIQLGIRRVRRTPREDVEEFEYVDRAQLLNVPVHFPQSGGYSFTIPVQPGDECLVMFTKQSAGSWKELGEVQDPQHKGRVFDMNDGFAMVGFSSLPKVITDFQMDGIELRTSDRSQYAKIKNSGSTIVKATGDILLDTPTVRCTGNLQVDGTINANSDISSGTKVSAPVVEAPSMMANGKEIAGHNHPAGSPPGNTGSNN